MSRLQRVLAGIAISFVTAGLGSGAGAVLPASAAAPTSAVSATAAVTTSTSVSAQSAKKFKSCKALNKKYKHGVKRSSGTKDVVRSGGHKKKYASKATVSKSIYKANKRKLDRDKDGIACEKR